MTQPWFRFYSEALRDRKLEYACRMTGQPKALVVGFWVTLLALGNDSPDRGALLIADNFPVTLADLSRDSELPEQDVATMLDALEQLKMIARLDEVIIICNWDKRQFASDDTTGRVQAWRSKQAKKKEGGTGETLQKRSEQQLCNTPETDTKTETDTETETELDTQADQIKNQTTKTERSASSDFFKKSVNEFENTIGVVSSGYLADAIKDMLEELESLGREDWWQMALDVASAQNVRKWVYVKGVLENCLKEGRPPRPQKKRPGAPTKRLITVIDPDTGTAREVEAMV